MRDFVRKYSLGLVLGGLFIASWLAQLFFQLAVVRAENAEHGQPFDAGDFWAEFGQATMENWQSEFLQLLSFVVLTTYFIYKGSHESKDSQDRMESKIDRILEAVDKPKE